MMAAGQGQGRHRHGGIIADRFIPVRSAMDFDLANYLLTRSAKERERDAGPASSPTKEAYRRALTNLVMPDGDRILAFRRRPASSSSSALATITASSSSSSLRLRTTASSTSPAKPSRSSLIRRRKKPDKTLDAPGLLDDYYRNLLDWGPANVLSIALDHTVHLWDAQSGAISELVTVDQDSGPITSISWARDGRHLAVGLDSSDVQLWDTTSTRLLRTLRGVHPSRVGSLAWNDHTLSTGGVDGSIVNSDVRSRSHAVQTYRGHSEEVCGLKWSTSGNQLASGGNDCLVHIWDISMASSSSPPPGQNQWLHRFADHTAGVKALAWCPFKSNLLASGGGAADCSIKFWSTATGSRLNSLDTGSQVCSLLWSKNTTELISSHASPRHQLTLWSYPSLAKVTDFTAHTARPLFTALSPDGWTLASAAGGGDETLRLWHAFGTPKPHKPAAAKPSAPFANCPYAHIRYFDHL